MWRGLIQSAEGLREKTKAPTQTLRNKGILPLNGPPSLQHQLLMKLPPCPYIRDVAALPPMHKTQYLTVNLLVCLSLNKYTESREFYENIRKLIQWKAKKQLPLTCMEFFLVFSDSKYTSLGLFRDVRTHLANGCTKYMGIKHGCSQTQFKVTAA